MTINLKAKLSAYTKNALLEQAPVDRKIYARKDGQWVSIDNTIKNVAVTIVSETHPAGGESYNFVTGLESTNINEETSVQSLEKLVPKSYVDKQFVPSSKQSGRLYGTAPNSFETYTFPYDTPGSNVLLNGRFIYRVIDGNILVPLTPSSEQHATSKKYVDDMLNTKLSIPHLPTSDGEYVLKCKIINGVASYSWEAE